MADLNVMMREHAISGLNAELDAAVTNGDTAKAREISKKISDFNVALVPKGPTGYGHAEIQAAIEAKADWFGVDPRKSAKALQFGKDLNPKKFATPELFAEAVIKAVEEEFKPTGSGKTADDNGGGDGEGDGAGADTDGDAGAGRGKPAAARRTDAPGEGDTLGNRGTARRTGPWTKLSDAPADIAKEINRSADKFLPNNATEEQRKGFISRALESHYAMHQRSKGKK